MNIHALTLLGSICNTIEYTISSTQIKLLPNEQTKKNYHEFERRPVEG